MGFWGLVIILGLIWIILSVSMNILQNINEIRKNKNAQLINKENEINKKEAEFNGEKIFYENKLKENIETIEILYKEKSQGFPWLAKAYSEYSILQDNKIADWLEKKPHPAIRSSEILRRISKEKTKSQRELRITKYLLEMYESLFPFLI